MTSELEIELGWYGGAIYFSAWGSAVGLGLLTGFFPRVTEHVLGLAHLNPAGVAATCIIIGHIVVSATARG